jgi:hypothetical protein
MLAFVNANRSKFGSNLRLVNKSLRGTSNSSFDEGKSGTSGGLPQPGMSPFSSICYE